MLDVLFFTELDGQSHEWESGYSQAFSKTLKQQGFPFEDGNWRLTATLSGRQQQFGFSLLDWICYKIEKKSQNFFKLIYIKFCDTTSFLKQKIRHTWVCVCVCVFYAHLNRLPFNIFPFRQTPLLSYHEARVFPHVFLLSVALPNFINVIIYTISSNSEGQTEVLNRKSMILYSIL